MFDAEVEVMGKIAGVVKVKDDGEHGLDVQVTFLDLPEKGVDAEKLANELAEAVRGVVEKYLE